MDRHRRHLALALTATTPRAKGIGQNESRHRRAAKVWDKRESRDFDDPVNWAPATSRWR